MLVWNNETLNIWSHLLGFLLFVVLTLYDNLITIPKLKGELTDHIVITLGLFCYQVYPLTYYFICQETTVLVCKKLKQLHFVLKKLFFWNVIHKASWYLLTLYYFFFYYAYQALLKYIYTTYLNIKVKDWQIYNSWFLLQFCMLCSTGFHIFACHSERASKRWLQVDMTGVSIGIIGCYLPAVHYAFYCISVWKHCFCYIFFQKL